MIITPATVEDVERIAFLHGKYLPSASSSIGTAYLRLLYLSLLKDRETNIGLVARENNEIAGAIFATKHLGKTQKQVTDALFPLGLLYVAGAIIRGKISPSALFRRTRFERELVSHYPGPLAAILTLFVVPAYRRNGVGLQLTGAVMSSCKTHGISRLFVDTDIHNSAARAFYTRAGFTKKEIVGSDIVFSIETGGRT